MVLRFRCRPAMVLLGAALLAVSLFGAKALTHGQGEPSASSRFSMPSIRPCCSATWRSLKRNWNWPKPA